MRQRGTFAVVALIPMLLTAGCSAGTDVGARPATPASAGAPSGGSSADAGAHGNEWDVSQMPDPCLTVTRAQVTAATKLPVGAGTTVDSWPPLCSFTVTGAKQEYLYVSSDPRPGARADFLRQRSDSQATEAIRGIGDEAYWLPEFTALHVLRGGTHLTVKLAGSTPPPDPKGRLSALARAALR